MICNVPFAMSSPPDFGGMSCLAKRNDHEHL